MPGLLVQCTVCAFISSACPLVAPEPETGLLCPAMLFRVCRYSGSLDRCNAPNGKPPPANLITARPPPLHRGWHLFLLLLPATGPACYADYLLSSRRSH